MIERTKRLLPTLFSKQFVVWVVLFTLAFTGAVLLLKIWQVGTLWAFIGGMLFGEVTNRGADWITDWYAAEKEAKGSAV